MQDHRQIVALRQRKLRVQQRFLTFELRILPIEIEADLADRDQPVRRRGKIIFQPSQARFSMPLNNDGMQTQRHIKGVVLLRQRRHAFKVIGFNGRKDDFFYSGLRRPLQTGAFIAGKRRKVEMAMSIDKARRHARSS